MAKRRVFRTRVKCPGVTMDLGLLANQRAMMGRTVAFEKASSFEVNLRLDGAVVGRLDAAVGAKVASAIDRGQVFTAVIENAFPIYNEKFKPTGAQVDIKVEYLLEKGQPAIETEKCWRCLEAPKMAQKPGSFFTKVAGVTFEGRQRIVARCSVGERLNLVRDPSDPNDNGAIKVVRLNGEQLGFIPAHVSRGGDSSGLAHRMDRGDKYQCRITDLTGGGYKNLGVNLEITAADDFETAGVQAQSNPACGAPIPSDAAHVRRLEWWLLAAVVLLFAVIISVKWG